MPHVRKADIFGVVRQLWSTGVVEDEAKLLLAERLIGEVWEGKKKGIPLHEAGVPIKAAMGDRWLSAHQRQAAGKPTLSSLLSEDPYFVLKDLGGSHLHVQLRITRLAQLIGNAELISQYKNAAGCRGPSSSAAAAKQDRVQFNSEGLPLRPGAGTCQHYITHGWCLFKQDCWYNHPDKLGKRKAAPGSADGLFIESHLEPGVLLRNGVYPVRPGGKLCSFYAKNGWCYYKAKCRNDHPDLKDLQSAASSSGSGSTRTSPVPDAPDEALVRQPPQQQLLGLLIDVLWPPRASKENYVKGQIARHFLATHMAPGDIMVDGKTYDMPGSVVGTFVNRWWPTQSVYDTRTKPYTSLSTLLEHDPYFRVWMSGGTPMVTLLFGQLIDDGGDAAAERLSAMADAVWPPESGKESWLRGMLAKWLMDAGFKGKDDNRKVLPRVLMLGPEQPTVFRMDMAQAGEFLLRSWKTVPHPYDANSSPWTQLKPLIAGDRFLYIEPDPSGRAGTQHVTLDLADLLQNFSAAARTAQRTQRTSSSGAGSSSAAAPAAAGVFPSIAEEGIMDFEDDEESDDEVAALALSGASAWAAAAVAGGAAAAGGGGSSSQPQQQQQQPRWPSSAASSGRGVLGGVVAGGVTPRDVASAEAELSDIEAMKYEPPENMQWWWPASKPEKQDCCWTEIAIRLLDPAAEEFELQLAEMVQHLEISNLVAMACATYKSHPHLLQFFAPRAAIGGLEIPSAVYLLDVMRPGPRITEVLDLVRPVLASAQNTKVCHGSKLWSGQLGKAYNIHLVNYYDTQQANYVWSCLRHEAGRSQHVHSSGLKSTAEVSLSSLLRSYDLFHPVRHTDSGKDTARLWQDRPLSEELITCAAADVAYLLPLMEMQLRQLRHAASEVRLQQQQQQRPGSRAASLLSNLPPELSDPSALSIIAAGAEAGRGGGLSYERVRAIGSLEAFHQAPLHAAGLRLGESYGALRGVGRTF